MAEQLLTTSIQAPGFQGINKQDSAVGLDSGFATRAENCVIDRYGRIGSRNGWTPVHDAVVSIASSPVRLVTEFVTIDGANYKLAAAGNKIWTLNGSVLSEVTYGGGGTAPTITDDNWQAVNLNSRLYLYQRGHDPLVFDPGVSTTSYKRISEASGYLGTVQQSNCALSAFGRIWSAGAAANKSIIQFSDIMNGHILSTGSAGILDVSSVWPDGEDEIVALAAHNNSLFVFGRRQILVYQNPSDPYAMSLQDTITGIGCLARDSVVVAGTDVIFLSDTGVRSLQRTIQEKSAPMRELSLNVKNDLIVQLATEDVDNIKSVYSDVHAFYLLSLPTNDTVWVFDMRQPLQNGSARTTTWTGITPTAFLYSDNRTLYLGKTGYVGKYEGFSDNGTSFPFAYYTNFFDFQSPTQLKLLKKVAVTFVGNAESTINIRWGFDYQDTFYSRAATIQSSEISYFGVDEFGLASYTTGSFVQITKVNVGGSGTVLQLGIETPIDGNSLSVQRIDCYVKQGKTL
jgi:hypothetical protein